MVKVRYIGHGVDSTAAQRAYYQFQEIDNSKEIIWIYKKDLKSSENANIKNIISIFKAMPYKEMIHVPPSGSFSETNFRIILLIPEIRPYQFTETWQIIEIQSFNENAARDASHP